MEDSEGQLAPPTGAIFWNVVVGHISPIGECVGRVRSNSCHLFSAYSGLARTNPLWQNGSILINLGARLATMWSWTMRGFGFGEELHENCMQDGVVVDMSLSKVEGAWLIELPGGVHVHAFITSWPNAVLVEFRFLV